jgi:hypothetical protein
MEGAQIGFGGTPSGFSHRECIRRNAAIDNIHPLVYRRNMKKRRNINLEAEQLRKIAVLSKKTGANPSAIIRLAIDEYLKRKKVK